MASLSFENSTIANSDALRSRSSEDEERLERFLRSINRSQLNINRSISVLNKVLRARSNHVS
jgi:hypothetical protein